MPSDSPRVGLRATLTVFALGLLVLGSVALSILAYSPETVVQASLRATADVAAGPANSAGSSARFPEAPAVLAYVAPDVTEQETLNAFPASTMPVELSDVQANETAITLIAATTPPPDRVPLDATAGESAAVAAGVVESEVGSEMVESLGVVAPVEPAGVPVAIPPVLVEPVATQQPGTPLNGPAGVIGQIPASAWQWLDANGWAVDWRQGPGPGRIAEAQYANNTIVIWYSVARTDEIWAGALAHELGHAVSYVHFSEQQMADWTARRGLASWRWVPGTPNDFGVGEGDFAEAFMSYLLGHEVRSAGGQLSPTDAAWIAANTPF